MTATGHCPVPVLPRRAQTSFPGRVAAPLRFAALPAWVQKGSWAGLRSASASAVTLCWPRATPPSWLVRPHSSHTAHQHTQQDGRAAPATRATGFCNLLKRRETQEESAETRCRPHPVCERRERLRAPLHPCGPVCGKREHFRPDSSLATVIAASLRGVKVPLYDNQNGGENDDSPRKPDQNLRRGQHLC